MLHVIGCGVVQRLVGWHGRKCDGTEDGGVARCGTESGGRTDASGVARMIVGVAPNIQQNKCSLIKCKVSLYFNVDLCST